MVFLDSLTAVLSQLGYKIVAMATTRHGLLEDVSLYQPDICVTGNHFPDGDIVDLIGQLSCAHPDTKIVVLTADGDPNAMRKALDAGASGYVHKSCCIASLSGMLHRVIDGGTVIDGSFLRASQQADTSAEPDLRRLATFLTPRELECLALLTEG